MPDDKDVPSTPDQDKSPAPPGYRQPAKGAKPAAKKPAPKSAKASQEDDLDDEDDDLDDDEDFEDEDEDEDDEPPPPRKTAAKPASKTAARAPVKKAPAKKVVAKASARRKPARRLPRPSAASYLPFALVGMGIIALHVYYDLPFAPIATFGIAIVIWAYMGIGSANEITSLAARQPGAGVRAVHHLTIPG
jgi:hypothetical protein